MWQPIETAPKDWSDVILFDPDRSGAEVFCGYFSCADGGGDRWKLRGLEDGVNPTHWMPLPPPPTEGGE